MSQLQPGESRFSVGFIIPEIVRLSTGEIGHFGLYSKWAERRGIPNQYSAIGGAALLTDAGLEYVASIGGRLEKPEKRDARFFVASDRVRMVADRFRNDPMLLMSTPIHELDEELCGDELGHGPITTHDRLTTIEMASLGWVIMNGSPILRPDSAGRVRDHGDVSERIFQGFSLLVPDDVWDVMNDHRSLHRFTEEEIAAPRRDFSRSSPTRRASASART